jgi:hypothetical protein
MGSSVNLKTTVRREVGELARLEAKRRNLSVSNYLCRILEDRLLGDNRNATWSLEDLERASQEARAGKAHQSVDEMLEEIFHGQTDG